MQQDASSPPVNVPVTLPPTFDGTGTDVTLKTEGHAAGVEMAWSAVEDATFEQEETPLQPKPGPEECLERTVASPMSPWRFLGIPLPPPKLRYGAPH